MSNSACYSIWMLATIACASITAAFQDLRDPTPQEIAFMDWTSGANIAACGEGILDNVTSAFRSAFAAVLNDYCQNFSTCRLENVVNFTPANVMLLDSYPRREYYGVRLRFIVVFSSSSVPEQRPSLLTREVISSVFSERKAEIESRMQLPILEFERYPRFDSLTEFMNTAVIPLGFLLMVVMFGLAYWATTLTSNRSGGSSWFSGTCKDKGDSEKKQLEALREQTEREMEEGFADVAEVAPKRKRFRFSWRKKSSKTSLENESPQGSSPGLIRQNAINITSRPFSSDSIDSSAHEADINETSALTTRQLSQSSATGKRFIGFQRRLSTFEEVFKERKRRKTRRSGGNGRRGELRWKSTSMALGGFRGK